VNIREIDLNDRQAVNKFISFPFDLYRESAFWAPPLISGVKESLSPEKHPFYKHSKAAFFLAEDIRKGITLGRLAVCNNRNFNRYNNSRTAFFSYFDCLNRPAVAEALFAQARQWAQKENLNEIIGPRGLAAGEGGGVLVDGFDEKSIMGVPYNYDYYDNLITMAGFKKNTDYYSGYLNRDNTLSIRYRRIAYKLAQRRGFMIKEFSGNEELFRWIEKIIEAHSLFFSENHTYFPPTKEEIAHLIKTLKGLVDYRLVKLVLKNDQIVGFLICLPDLSGALRRNKGSLWPWGWCDLLMEKKRTRHANVNLLAVHPAYRGLGVIALLYTSLAETFFHYGFEKLELVTVEEGNRKALAENNLIGAHWYKRHRDYRLAI
jgi:GNAT superfamily N-acetyltransferase